MHRLLLGSFLALFLVGCSSMPKTAEQSYKWSRVATPSSGGQFVVGPEISFTSRGVRGVTSFQALIRSGRITYMQRTVMPGLADADGTFETTRAKMEGFRKVGASMGIAGSSVRVKFSAAYIDGFLRRVDDVAKGR